jgi:uncharacterized protein YcbX
VQVGRVTGLTRYPVKSMQGEDVEAATVGPRGLDGDRAWAVYTEDGGIGSGKTTRRFRRVDGLLRYRAVLDGIPLVFPPSGPPLRADDPAAGAALSLALGRPLRLRREAAVAHHDESPLHLVTTASLRRVAALAGGTVDVRRLRANVVLEVAGDDFAEDRWTGRELVIGDVVLGIGAGMPRCVMLDAAPARARHDPKVLRLLTEVHGMTLGVQAHVLRSGTIRVGDRAVLR